MALGDPCEKFIWTPGSEALLYPNQMLRNRIAFNIVFYIFHLRWCSQTCKTHKELIFFTFHEERLTKGRLNCGWGFLGEAWWWTYSHLVTGQPHSKEHRQEVGQGYEALRLAQWPTSFSMSPEVLQPFQTVPPAGDYVFKHVTRHLNHNRPGMTKRILNTLWTPFL